MLRKVSGWWTLHKLLYEMAWMLSCKLCTHISSRLHKTMPAYFLTMSYSIFITRTQVVLKVHFGWKQLKADYSKNTWKKRKLPLSFLSLGWLHISEKKIIEDCNSVSAGAHKLVKGISFGPTFDSSFPSIWR